MNDPVSVAAAEARAWWMSPASHGAVDTPEAYAARLIWQDVADLHNAFLEAYHDRGDLFAAGVNHVLCDLGWLLWPNDGVLR